MHLHMYIGHFLVTHVSPSEACSHSTSPIQPSGYIIRFVNPDVLWYDVADCLQILTVPMYWILLYAGIAQLDWTLQILTNFMQFSCLTQWRDS